MKNIDIKKKSGKSKGTFKTFFFIEAFFKILFMDFIF